MAIDLSKLNSGNNANSLINPKEIFRVLPNKDKDYKFPRDVQSEVWARWMENKQAKDNILKMNTGCGKTVVGLLILKSSINEGNYPAVYVAPTPFLAEQAEREAENLGLNYTNNTEDLSFKRGDSILITTIKKIFNGKSKFGVKEEGNKIEISSIVIDDTHACLQEVEEQFTIRVNNDSQIYEELFSLFSEDISQQSETKKIEIENGDPTASSIVPFWSWENKIEKIIRILHENKNTDELIFTWPLLKEVISNCRCVISGKQAEISPLLVPVDVIPSFSEADRRIFMSATFSDDSILVTHFDVQTSAFENLIVPDSANDIGDRMILVPQAYNTGIEDDSLRKYIKDKSQQSNAVVIVPSWYAANKWDSYSDQTLSSENLREGINKLLEGYVGLTVIVNRYDGIDLPYDACRLLVIDGLPDVRREIDKIDPSSILVGGNIRTESIHRIEQGMGRSIRAVDDWSVVFLMGSTLTDQLYRRGAKDRFTDATKSQIVLSENLSEQIKELGFEGLDEAVNYCFDRDSEWITASKSALADLEYKKRVEPDNIAITRRMAFNASNNKDHSRAAEIIQEIADECQDSTVKGWLLSELAYYQNKFDPAGAQVTLKSAKKFNVNVVNPIEGISYSRIPEDVSDQARNISNYLESNFGSSNELMIYVNSLLDNIRFEPNSSEAFEQAFADVGALIGFGVQRPESEYSRGPDLLWKMGDLKFAVIEAKNGATNETIKKHDINQLSGSINWFYEKYDNTCQATPVIVHPGFQTGPEGFPPEGARSITTYQLNQFKKAIYDLFSSVANDAEFARYGQIVDLLRHHKLYSSSLIDNYSVSVQSG